MDSPGEFMRRVDDEVWSLMCPTCRLHCTGPGKDPKNESVVEDKLHYFDELLEK